MLKRFAIWKNLFLKASIILSLLCRFRTTPLKYWAKNTSKPKFSKHCEDSFADISMFLSRASVGSNRPEFSANTKKSCGYSQASHRLATLWWIYPAEFFSKTKPWTFTPGQMSANWWNMTTILIEKYPLYFNSRYEKFTRPVITYIIKNTMKI